MSQTERLYKIDQMLNDRGVVSFQHLQDALGVSRATLKRDLEYMRSRLNAPIEWCREANGYRFTKPAGQSKTGPAYALPGLWFNEREIHALLTMQHLLSSLNADGLLGHHIAPLMSRLNAMLGATKNDADDIRQRVFISSVGRRPLPLAHFQQIGHAVIAGQRLRITYSARTSGQTTERVVSPLRLVHYRENWYLDAWCHLREEVRNFSVDMIRGAQLIEEKAKRISLKRVANAMGPAYGIFAQGDVKLAQLRFSPYRSRWVAHEQWHPRQKGQFDDEGRYLLTVPYADHRELLMDILKYGADCEVLAPSDLRSRVREEAKALFAFYSAPA
ncbi:MAG: YafY family protein [Aquabacterium sp.]